MNGFFKLSISIVIALASARTLADDLQSVWIDASAKTAVAAGKARRCHAGIATDSVADCAGFSHYMKAHWREIVDSNEKLRSFPASQIQSGINLADYQQYSLDMTTIARVSEEFQEAKSSGK